MGIRLCCVELYKIRSNMIQVLALVVKQFYSGHGKPLPAGCCWQCWAWCTSSWPRTSSCSLSCPTTPCSGTSTTRTQWGTWPLSYVAVRKTSQRKRTTVSHPGFQFFSSLFTSKPGFLELLTTGSPGCYWVGKSVFPPLPSPALLWGHKGMSISSAVLGSRNIFKTQFGIVLPPTIK